MSQKIEQKRICKECNKVFITSPARKDKFCSKSCWVKFENKNFKGERSSRWKGGLTKSPDGYIREFCPNHPFANNHGYVMRHRLIMEQQIGRYLLPREIVHHKNGIIDDNRIGNLELCGSRKEHSQHHIGCPRDNNKKKEKIFQIIAFINDHDGAKISDIVTTLKIPIQSVKRYVGELVNQEILLFSLGKPRLYKVKR